MVCVARAAHELLAVYICLFGPKVGCDRSRSIGACYIHSIQICVPPQELLSFLSSVVDWYFCFAGWGGRGKSFTRVWVG
ncbi:uncharacterized protein K489DRAFT_136847 [Dissoconium aciculare CBS 342.82]|uniref:Uncharacterized protein n=1 Tax=Dissoconium aciculare CBS 342.82 TaxID=1314786 RepID=A0A6J3LRT3_9PEZI|nr:uncharacterized protein K489DRAFT_136847 [Dissoconium aciculare CBS 342.82]KAF1817989.1 hypothetical protein K489DRAFT_136847 [Dissoconium aciculare CBS 342.82]